MEFWARWAHKSLWHASLWEMHESHHRPREGPFEVNDVFAVINAVPAIFLLQYGLFHRGFFPGLCFGAVSTALEFFCGGDDADVASTWTVHIGSWDYAVRDGVHVRT